MVCTEPITLKFLEDIYPPPPTLQLLAHWYTSCMRLIRLLAPVILLLPLLASAQSITPSNNLPTPQALEECLRAKGVTTGTIATPEELTSCITASSISLPQQTPTSSTGSASGSCPTLYRTLRKGARGTDVTELQTFLITQGDLARGNTTSYFGPLTEAAVKSFQRRNTIVSSGSPSTTGYGAVGPKTRAKIQEVCGGGH